MSFLLMAAGTVSMAMSLSQRAPELIYSCDAAAMAEPSLCDAFAAELEKTAAGYRVRRTDEAPGTQGEFPAALSVTLYLDRREPNLMVAHLEWRKNGSATIVGDQLSFDVQDSGLTATMYPSFLSTLIRHANLPIDRTR